MQTYYSTLLVPLRPEIKEQISVGLFLRDDDRIYFQFSSGKLNWLKLQLPLESFRLLKQSLNSISRLLGENANINNGFEYTLFSEHLSNKRLWDKNYISYLSQYNHNLLIFSPPQPISIKADQNSFRELFKLFVSDDLEIVEKEKEIPTIETYLEEHFYHKIEERVNTDIELTSDNLPSLFLPTKVDFIGQNDQPVVGRQIQFEKRFDYVGRDLREIYTLVKAFEEENINNGKYYIIGEEPNSNNFQKSHGIWNTIRKSKSVDFVDYREVELIADYIKIHNVHPFISSE